MPQYAALTFTRDDQTLASASYETVHLWDLRRGPAGGRAVPGLRAVTSQRHAS